MADVELQEQTVPLKSAEQTATEGAETVTTTTTTTTTTVPAEAVPVAVSPQGEEVSAPPKGKEKKGGGWFAKKKSAVGGDEAAKKGTANDGNNKTEKEESGAEAAANNVKDEAQKKMKKDTDNNGTKRAAKCPFSLCRGVPKVEESSHADQQQQQQNPWGEQRQQPTTFRFDLVQRDSAKLQETIDLGVHDIFGEPDAVHSMNGVWKTSLTVFLAVRNFCYKMFSLFFAIPLAVLFGILFALFSVLSVFVFVPVGRLLSIPFGWLAKLWSVLISAICDPLCRSFALTFGNVKVSRYGINQDPTAVVLSST